MEKEEEDDEKEMDKEVAETKPRQPKRRGRKRKFIPATDTVEVVIYC